MGFPGRLQNKHDGEGISHAVAHHGEARVRRCAASVNDGFRNRAECRRAGQRTAKNASDKRRGTATPPKREIGAKQCQHQAGQHGKVQRQSIALERFEEAGCGLQSDAIDEQDESQRLNLGRQQDARDAKAEAAGELDFADQVSQRNDDEQPDDEALSAMACRMMWTKWSRCS